MLVTQSLCKSFSFDLFLAVVATVLACPAPELFILAEQELERLADYVGRVCIKEFRVLIQGASDFFLQTDLQGCGLGLFRW